MTQRSSLPLVLLSCLLGVGCASRRDAGQALVASGAVVAIAASEVAAHQVGCVQTGCAAQTSRHAPQAAAGVAAGVALAAAGAALASEPSVDSVAPPKVTAKAPQRGNWRLVRTSEEAEESRPAYYIEE